MQIGLTGMVGRGGGGQAWLGGSLLDCVPKCDFQFIHGEGAHFPMRPGISNQKGEARS